MDADVKGFPGLNVERGAIIAKRFEICEQLGAGGVGMVFRAKDHELEEVVALKLLLPHLAQDEAVFKRFRNEVLVARSLSHPNIVRTHDIGRAEAGYSYISMEFVDGKSLKEKIQTVRATTGFGFPFEEGLGILFHIISGIAYAHGRGVIHRDIKPANVLIGSSGEVKLADFGTARIVGADTSLTQTGQVIGTPDYMSPEQIRGESLTSACDVYSLGILAYELIAGERPFVAETAVAIAFKHLNDPLPPLRERIPDVPEWFEGLIQRMTAKRRDERFDSTADLMSALIERAPQLSVQSTVFRWDPSSIKKPSAQGTVSAALPDPPHPSRPGGQDTGSSLSGRSRPAPDDRYFELGNPSTNGSDGDAGWRLDLGDSGSQRSVPVIDEPQPKLRWQVVVPAVAAAMFLAVTLLPRLSTAVSAAVQEMIGEEGKGSAFSSVLAGLTGVTPKKHAEHPAALPHRTTAEVRPAVKPTPPAVAATASPDAARDELVAELKNDRPKAADGAASAPSDSRADEPAAAGAGTPRDTAGTNQVGSSPPNVPSQPPAPDVQVAKVNEPVTEPVSKTPPAPPTPEPPLEAFSASLELRDGGRPASGPFAIDKLGSVRWTSEIRGLGSGSKPPAEKSVKSDFTVNVVEAKTARVVTRLKVEQADPGQPGAKPARISGSLAGMRSVAVQPGTYRLDLLHSGEVVSSRELGVYRMQIAADGAVGAAGGQAISIVRGAGVAGEESSTEQTPPSAPQSSGAQASGAQSSGARGPAEQAVDPVPALQPPPVQPAVSEARSPDTGSPQNAGGVRTENLIPPIERPPVVSPPVGITASGLPPAKGMENLAPPTIAPQPPDSGALTQPDPAPGQPISGAPLDRYRGTLSFSDTDRRSFTMQMTVNGSKLAGSADIEGYGHFVIEGDVFERGLVFTLQNDTHWLKLTSGKPDQNLRGRFSFPKEQKNGPFEATRLR